MKKLSLILIACTLVACTSLERTAYNTVVAAKGFLDSEKAQHPECAPNPNAPAGTSSSTLVSGSTVCTNLSKAVGAKDALIDAITVYCSGPEFNTGGACNPPAKGTPAAQQAAAKLQAAIAQYNQTAADLKTATGGK